MMSSIKTYAQLMAVVIVITACSYFLFGVSGGESIREYDQTIDEIKYNCTEYNRKKHDKVCTLNNVWLLEKRSKKLHWLTLLDKHTSPGPFWVKVIITEGKKIKSFEHLTDYGCNPIGFKRIKTYYYKDIEGKEPIRTFSDKPSDWVYPSPNSEMYHLVDERCLLDQVRSKK